MATLKLSLATCLVLTAATLLTAGARRHWMLDLCCHFHVQHTVAAFFPFTAMLLLRRWFLALFPTALLAYHLWVLSPVMPTFTKPPPSAESVRAVMSNVLTSNPHKEKLQSLIRETNPGFFALVETDRRWVASLAALETAYPHRITAPRPDNFGMVLFSRYPIVSQKQLAAGALGLPLLVAELETPGANLTVIVAHPLPPLNRRNMEERSAYLQQVEEEARNASGAVMVMGDLNITSESPYFTDLLAGGDLRDSRAGFGVQPSWPALPWPFRMCIDHVLVSPGVTIANRYLGDSIGSDHLPVVVEFNVE